MQKEMNKKCRLCGHQGILIKYEANSCEVGSCKNCGFVQVLNKPSEDQIKQLYSDDYFKRGKYVNDKAIYLENKRRINWLLKNGVKKGSRVLDAGCATGDFIESAKGNFDMWGIDVGEYAVNRAKSINPEISSHIFVNDLENLGSIVENFDAIVLWDVIEHLWNPMDVISKLKEKLNPGGIIAVSTPNIGALSARILGKYWPFMTVPEHLSFFNKSAMFYLAKNNNLMPIGWKSRGKWVNLGFFLYKINKVLPRIMPKNIVDKIKNKNSLAGIVIYAPSGDIQYLAAKLQ